MFGYTLIKKERLKNLEEQAHIAYKLQSLCYWFSGFDETFILLKKFAAGEINHLNIFEERKGYAKKMNTDEYGRSITPPYNSKGR